MLFHRPFMQKKHCLRLDDLKKPIVASRYHNSVPIINNLFIILFLQLVALLMSALVGWQDDPNDIDDFDDWTPFKGACSCLMLLAQCCSNTVAAYVTPKIINYITVT